VDPTRREVTFSDAGSLTYDLLSLDIGGKTAGTDVRGVAQNAVVIRPLETAAQAWKTVLSRVSKGSVGSVTLVGAGAAGIELALAMDHRLKADFGEHAPHVRVLGDKAPLAEIPRDARNMLLACVRKHGIGLHTGTGVAEVGADFVQLEGGLQFASDVTFWTAGTAPPDLARDSGLATDERGFFLTNDCLQSTSHADVFAAGDCASRQGRDLPKAGVFAVRAAPILAANLRAAMTGAPLAAHRTGKRYLALISTGGRNAVGFWNGFAWDGAWAWRWKDRIDRRFVAKYA
jgi:selenide,water dikinase